MLPWDFGFGFLSQYLFHFNCKANTAVVVHITQWETLQSKTTALWFINSGVFGYCRSTAPWGWAPAVLGAPLGETGGRACRLGPSLCPDRSRAAQGTRAAQAQLGLWESLCGSASSRSTCWRLGQGRSVLGPHHVSLWADMGRCFNCLYRLGYWRNKINSYSENADSIILPWFSVSWLVLLCLNEIYTCRHRYNPVLFSTAFSVIKLWIDLHHH